MARGVNQAGMSVSIDNLGESVTNIEEARASAALYHQLLDQISAQGLNANISLKLRTWVWTLILHWRTNW